MTKDRIKINVIIEKYNENFPINWLSDLQSIKEEDCADTISKEIKKIDSFLIESYYIFATSVLSGEYIVKPVIDSLDSLLECMCEDKIYDGLSDIQAKLMDQLKIAESIIKYAIDQYKEVISILENNCRVKQPKQYVSLVQSVLPSRNTYPYKNLYKLLFDVVRNDIMPSYNEETIAQLLSLQTSLSYIITNKKFDSKIIKVCSVLYEKCLLLLKKILKSDNKEEVDYLVDYKQRHFGSDITVAKCYSQFMKRFEFYIKEKYTNRENIACELDDKFYEKKGKIWEIPLLLKYYKDLQNTSLKQIDNIVNDFKKLLKSYRRESDFDTYALATLENFVINTRFSFKISHLNPSPEKVLEDLREIEFIQARTGIKNYYPYKKVLVYLIDYIRSHRNDSTIQINKLLDSIDNNIIKLENALLWCKEQNFIPIQSPYSGCLVRDRDFGVIFLPSTYCRPLHYEKLFDELNKLKIEAVVLRNEGSILQYKSEVQSLKEQIDNSNRRLIDIFTLFVSVAAFIFGSIEFFASNTEESASEMLNKTLSLGLILLLFSSSISILTMRELKKFWHHPRFIISAIMFVVYAILLIIFLCTGE